MSDFTIKSGDTSPALEFQLQEGDGSAVSLTDVNEVRFLMQSVFGDNPITADTAGGVSIQDAQNGIVRYEWQGGDTDTAGSYQAEWEVEYGSGEKETFPNAGYITININKDIG